MAENIKVVVEVDKGQLDGLRDDISSLNGSTIQVSVDATGLDAVAANIRNVLTGITGAGNRGGFTIDTRSLQQANAEVTKLVNTFNKDGQLISAVTTANRSLAVVESTMNKIDAATGNVTDSTTTLTANYKQVNQAAQELYHSHEAISESMQGYVNAMRQDPAMLQGPASPEAIARNQMLTEAIEGVGRSYKDAEVSARAFAGGLTETERALNNADMAAARNVQVNGELIDSQEVWRDGSLIKSIDTYRDSIGNVTKVTTELNGTQARTTITTRQNSEAMKKQADAAELAAKKNSLLGDSLDRIVAKIVAWQVINAAVATVIRSFKNAIETMKEVDSALVTIRKTTDLAESQIAQLTDKTYELATAYGRTADELLNLSATFARAGYGDQLEEMTELAALLENVGDIEGDTAAKFLLAANAAWKLGGDYDSLMGIIDGMNAVTNQAAVDMEALTNGITVAGAVFANAGESAQTYTAMVGTAVAATQRSGNEIARGLRTIAMNVRQIKGELEDGEIIDEASISDAAKALSSVGISVADANGELRLTSDVLGELAGKWDELTTAEQSYLAQSLAGKRQANILTALMQNWGEVERQMELYANGAGSAMRENELYLDSWEAKTKQLTAAWTEFISHLINTETVKNALDALTSIIKALDTNFGRAVITTLAFSAALLSVSKSIKAISAAKFIKQIGTMVSAIQSATTATEVFSAVWKTSPFVVITAAIAAVYGLAKLLDALKVSTDEAAQAMRDASSAYDEAQANVESLNQKLAENIQLLQDASIVGKDESYRQRLAEENQLLREQIEEQLTLAQVKKQEAIDNAVTVAQSAFAGTLESVSPIGFSYIEGPSEETVQAWIEARNELQNAVEESKKWGTALDEDVLPALENVNAQLDIYMEKQQESNEAADFVVEGYERLTEAAIELSETGEISAETVDELAKQFPTWADEIRNAADDSEALATVLDALSSQLIGSADAADDASGEMGAFSSIVATINDPATWLATVLGEDASAFQTEADAAAAAEIQTKLFKAAAENASGQPVDTSLAVSSLGNLEGQSYNTAAALIALQNVFAQIGAMDARISTVTSMASDAVGIQAQQAAAQLYALYTEKASFDFNGSFQQAYQEALAVIDKSKYSGGSNTGNKTGGGGGKKGGGGGGGGKTTDTVLEGHKALVSLLEAELDLMEERGDSTDDQLAQIDLIQAALHNEAEYLRSINADEEEIVKLSERWWKYEREKVKLHAEDEKYYKAELSLMQNRGDHYTLQVAKMRQIQDSLHVQAEMLRAIEGESEEVVKLSAEWWSYEEKIEKLMQKELEDRYKVLKSERGLMKERGDATIIYIRKQRELQDSLHEQAEALRQTDEYLRGDKETIAEINELSTEWWEIENDIKDVLEDILDEFSDTANEIIDNAEKAELDPLNEQLEILKAQKKEIKDTREEEEKILAVEKARIALENAERERNIRQYNASTGQWEWVANAKTVEAAREALAKAEQDLADYYLDKSIESVEQNIEIVEKSYEELRDAIKDFAQKIKDGAEDLDTAFANLANLLMRSGIGAGAIGAIAGAAGGLSGAYAAANGGPVYAMSNGNAPGGLPYYTEVITAGGTYTIVPPGTNGATFNPESGYYSIRSSQLQTTANTSVSSGGSGGNTSSSGSTGSSNSLGALAALANARGMSLPTFDSGGILHGVGGIKATYGNEMVLPPEATAGLLDAEQSGAFDALLAHLGIVTSAANGIAGFGSPVLRSSIGSQHNGDVFEINGVTIGEAQARSTTIYDFAQMAKLLSLRNGA